MGYGWRLLPYQYLKISNISIAKRRSLRDSWKKPVGEALVLHLSHNVVLAAVERAVNETNEVKRLLWRTRQVRTSHLNINQYCEHQASWEFRVKAKDISRLSYSPHFPELTSENECSCSSFCATAITLHRFCTASGWYDVEIRFGLFASELSELFWEMI